MVADIFRTRERALEYDYFRRVDDKLLRDLRNSQQALQKRRALGAATGIRDQTLLARLLELEFVPETVHAIWLFPLVWVAWADGHVDQKQRQLILDATLEAGHRLDSAGYRLVKAWLDIPPTAKTAAVWQDYIDHILRSVSGRTRTAIGEDTMMKARRVADATSLTFGFHHVEDAQLRVLRAIEDAVFAHADVEPCT